MHFSNRHVSLVMGDVHAPVMVHGASIAEATGAPITIAYEIAANNARNTTQSTPWEHILHVRPDPWMARTPPTVFPDSSGCNFMSPFEAA